MTSKEMAWQSFWERFSIPAYDRYTVPKDATLPYITYNATFDSIDRTLVVTASIWYRSKAWASISHKADEISQEIGYGGVLVPYEHGCIWIKRGTPFAQRMDDPEDNMIRRIVLNLEIEFLSS